MLVPAAWAQLDQAAIKGTISDSTNAVIPNARVTARNVDTNLSHSAVTNLSGVYVIGPVRIGTYGVSVDCEGFKKAVRPGVELHPNDRIGLNFTLELGSVVEVMEVTGATPILQTEEASLSHLQLGPGPGQDLDPQRALPAPVPRRSLQPDQHAILRNARRESGFGLRRRHPKHQHHGAADPDGSEAHMVTLREQSASREGSTRPRAGRIAAPRETRAPEAP